MKRTLWIALWAGIFLTTAGTVSAAVRTARPTAGKPTAALPASVDLRPRLDELGLGPRRQGRRPTCSVFTTVATLEFALAQRRGKGTELSVEYLNWACNQVLGGEPRNHGQFFHNLLEAFRQHGICPESDMPYRRRFDRDVQPSPEAIARAKRIGRLPFKTHWINPLKSHAGLTDEQFQEIKSVLARGWPVAAGSGHSRLLVGYRDDASEPGGGVFLTKDSGSGSYGQVTYEFVKKDVGDVFWVEWPEDSA